MSILEVETGIEPVCTALQAVASPLGHSTVGVDACCTLRADDGIRTRDPHLGKVMRYQLRHIRELRTRSSPVAKHDISPPGSRCTNPLVPAAGRRSPGSQRRPARGRRLSVSHPVRVSLRRRLTGLVAQRESVRLTRGRSLVRSQSGPQNSSPVDAPVPHIDPRRAAGRHQDVGRDARARRLHSA